MIVSIIIPLYNGSLLVTRCLDSIFNQKVEFDLEVIVIDDGSTDNSADIILTYSGPVKFIRQSNLGPAAARNKGIENSNGKYLAFLDSDDYWEPDFLSSTVKFLESNPEAIAVSVGQLHKIIGKPDTIMPAILRGSPDQYTEPSLINDFFEFWAEHNHVCTGSVLMRTEIVKETGGQREDLRITEDLEFWAYLATFGKWGFIPKILFVSDGSLVTRERGWIEKNKNRWASAPSITEWEKRIIQRLSKPLSEGYLFTRGRIAGNIAYSMILSSRDKQAKQIVLENKQYLVDNKLIKILRFAVKVSLLWSLACISLRFREKNRMI